MERVERVVPVVPPGRDAYPPREGDAAAVGRPARSPAEKSLLEHHPAVTILPAFPKFRIRIAYLGNPLPIAREVSLVGGQPS